MPPRRTHNRRASEPFGGEDSSADEEHKLDTVSRGSDSSSPSPLPRSDVVNNNRSSSLGSSVRSLSRSSPQQAQRQGHDPFTNDTGANSSFAAAAGGSGGGGGGGAATDDRSRSVDFCETFDVGVHVYDLSKGFASKHSAALVGREGLAGIFHSGVVVYGFEYFFEGGVARAPKGHTRFGDKYEYKFVATTQVPQHKFEAWLREEVPKRFSLCHYKTVEHNCHHFSDAACRFLCDGARAPEFLLENTEELAATAIGRVVIPVFSRVNGGIQYEIAKQIKQHRAQRLVAARRRHLARAHASAAASPPPILFQFRTSGAQARSAIAWLVAAHDDVEDDFKMSIAERAAITRVAETIAANMDTIAAAGHVPADSSTAASWAIAVRHIDEFDLGILVDHIARMMEAKDEWQVPRAVHALSVLALSSQFVGVACYHKRLNTLLMRLSYSFHRIAPSAQLCLLRTLCNYCGCPHGGAFVVDRRRVDHFLDAVGIALTSPSEVIRHAAASLLCNMTFAVITLAKGSITTNILKHSQVNAPMRMYILSHFHSHTKCSEPVLHRLLLAMFRLLTQGGELSQDVDTASIPFDLEGLLAQCSSEETRSLAVQVGFLLDIGDEHHYNAMNGIIDPTLGAGGIARDAGATQEVTVDSQLAFMPGGK